MDTRNATGARTRAGLLTFEVPTHLVADLETAARSRVAAATAELRGLCAGLPHSDPDWTVRDAVDYLERWTRLAMGLEDGRVPSDLLAELGDVADDAALGLRAAVVSADVSEDLEHLEHAAAMTLRAADLRQLESAAHALAL